MARVEDGNMIWTSADLDALNQDKIRLSNLIAHIQAEAPDAYATVFQDPNACSALVNDMLPNPGGLLLPRMTVPIKWKPPAKRKASKKGKKSKKKTAPKRGKAPARGKKHHKR